MPSYALPQKQALASEAELHGLVIAFYSAVRGDPLLGSIFSANVSTGSSMPWISPTSGRRSCSVAGATRATPSHHAFRKGALFCRKLDGRPAVRMPPTAITTSLPSASL